MPYSSQSPFQSVQRTWLSSTRPIRVTRVSSSLSLCSFWVFCNLFKVVGMLVISNWIEFAIFGLCQTFILTLIVKLFYSNPHLYFFTLQVTAAWQLTLFVMAFALFEKVKKEMFVIIYTHSKTKKILTTVFNAQPFPAIIVNNQGDI